MDFHICLAFRPLFVGIEQPKARDILAHIERIAGVRGSFSAVPTHLAHTEWSVPNPDNHQVFIDSRQRLFEIRANVLPTFCYDCPMRAVTDPSRFLVLGLYGDENGAARLCREHPDIQACAAENSVAQLGAQDVTGMNVFRVSKYPTE